MSKEPSRKSIGSSIIPYREIVDTMNDALVILDENECITFANYSFMELIGYKLPEILGRKITEFIDEENAQIIDEHSKLRRQGVSNQYELDWIHWTGDKVHTIVSATPIIEDGEYKGSFAVITDVTAQKIEQERRIRNERRFRILLESMNEAVTFVNPDLVIQYGNYRLFEMLGYQKDELLGMSLIDIVAETEVARLKQFFESEHPESKTLDLVMISKSGKHIHTIITPRRIYDSQGEVQGYIGVLLDVSELKHVYQKLEKTEAEYETLFHEMPVGLISVDPEGNVLNANRRAIEIIGVPSLEDLKKVNFLTSEIPIKIGIRDAIYECIMKKEAVFRETEYWTSWGRKGFGRYRLHPLLDSEGNLTAILGVFDDITDRKMMEDALRESEENYRNLAENSLQGISIIQDRRYVYVNQAFADIVGRSCEEILSMDPDTAWQIIHPDDREYLLELADKRRRGELDLHTYKYRFVRPDGEVRTVEAFSKIIDYRGAMALQVVVIDVTEREAALEELKKSQEMLRLVLKTIPQSVFWKDKNSVYLGCNDSFAKIAGVNTPEDIVGKTDYDLAWLREEAEQYRELDKRVIETGESIFGIVESVHIATGEVLWVETTKVPLYDAQGKIIGVLGTLQDITERREKEEHIRQSEEKYRTLAESSLQGLAIFATEGIIYANKSLETILGTTQEEMQRMSLDEAATFIHPEDRESVTAVFKKKFKKQPAPNNLEFRIVGKNNEVRWVETFVSSIEYEGKPAIQIVLIDITERREAEKEARTVRDRAELYLDIMSHDIRNHLQVIINSAALLRSASDESTKDSFLNIIMESIQRVSRLIDEVRATEELANSPMRTRDLLEALDLCVKAISQSSTRVQFSTSIKVDNAIVNADSFLELLITNILVNAIEHNPSMAKKVWIEMFEEDNGYTITIADNGPGIPDSTKATLFDRARRFGGLGLHQSQQIIEKYGGKLLIEDRVPGDHTQGAKFRIWIPKQADI